MACSIITWIADSGSTHHKTSHIQLISGFQETRGDVVQLADGQFAEVRGKGSVTIEFMDKCGENSQK